MKGSVMLLHCFAYVSKAVFLYPSPAMGTQFVQQEKLLHFFLINGSIVKQRQRDCVNGQLVWMADVSKILMAQCRLCCMIWTR
jgi:TolB-like protein